MSVEAIEWISLLLFVILFAAVVAGEIFWLVRKGWAAAGRATAFVLITDLVSFGISCVVTLGIMMALLMMTFGPAGRGSTAPEGAYILITVFGLAFPPIFLIILKRIFLAIFKIASGKTAWIYSVAVPVLILLIVLIPPPLLFYLATYFEPWKH